jgi:hypothetical protein
VEVVLEAPEPFIELDTCARRGATRGGDVAQLHPQFLRELHERIDRSSHVRSHPGEIRREVMDSILECVGLRSEGNEI